MPVTNVAADPASSAPGVGASVMVVPENGTEAVVDAGEPIGHNPPYAFCERGVVLENPTGPVNPPELENPYELGKPLAKTDVSRA